MLTLAAALFFSAPSCPAAFSSTTTTIGAISDSTALSLCVAKAVLVAGTDGSVKLVINSSQSAPKCLIYPIGLSPDLTFDLLSSGHTGCWSLYPPNQSVAIVNVGTPSKAKVLTALKSFRPSKPLIFYQPAQNLRIAEPMQFSSSAKTELIRCSIMNLPCRIRFTPITYFWNISGTKSKLAKPTYRASQVGLNTASLTVSYSLEYSFTGLTSWQRVVPNILLNAPNRTFIVGGDLVPSPGRVPRLVSSICNSPKRWGC